MYSRIAVVFLLAGLLAAGCGESKSDKAMAEVCAARDDITKQIDHLKGLTATTATTSAIGDSLKAVRDDLATIADAQKDLSEERQKDVQAANDAFAATFRDTLGNVGTTVSVEGAATQLTSAIEQLGASYQDTFGKLDCS
jgi:hypothetical protein